MTSEKFSWTHRAIRTGRSIQSKGLEFQIFFYTSDTRIRAATDVFHTLTFAYIATPIGGMEPRRNTPHINGMVPT
jgi:hypothetical protein